VIGIEPSPAISFISTTGFGRIILFVFHVPYQELGGTDTNRVKYFPSPSDIKGTVLHLLAEIDDEEWIYWRV